MRVPPGAWRAAAPAVLMAAWGGNHFSPLLLLYRQVDGYTAVQVDLFFAFYVLGLIPGFLIAGPLSDRHGRKTPVAAALALGVAGSVILAFGSASVTWMCAGRLVSGVSVAVAMVVGTSWIKELSLHDADPPVQARRASLTLTAGFGIGAGVSGTLAQWGPAPTLLPYAVQIVLSIAATVPLARARDIRTRDDQRVPPGPVADIRTRDDRRVPPAPVPDIRTGDDRRGSWLPEVRIPRGSRRRFAGVVLPMAPWVFAAPALAFVVAPALVSARIAGHRVAFAALLAVVTLCFGAAVQPYVPTVARWTGGRQAAAGLAVIALATAVLARYPSVVLTLFTAALLGVGYGICIVSGLVEVQAMAGPEDLAGLTGVYYSLTYAGFALPVILAALAHAVSYEVLLLVVAAATLGCALLVGTRRPAGR